MYYLRTLSRKFLRRSVNLQIRHCKKFYCCLSKINLYYQTLIGQRLTIFHQLLSWTSEVDQFARPSDSLSSFLNTTDTFFKDTFFEMSKFRKKEPINFCKSNVNEGISQLLLRSNHFINPTVWYLVFGLNFTTSIPVMITYHKSI